MRTFRDNTGRDWQIEITYGAVIRVRDMSGGRFDLLRPEAKIDVEDHGPLLFSVAVQFDMPTMFRLLAMILTRQIAEEGLTELDFAERLTGGALEQARAALVGEWRDFFQSLRREDLATLLEKIETWRTLGLQAIQERMATANLETADKAVMDQLNSTPMSTFGDSAAFAESTRAP